MSAEPPSSERPTGPPSGPLSGRPDRASVPPPPDRPSRPSEPGGTGDGTGGPGGPAGPGGPGDVGGAGGAGGAPEPGGGAPWWRSVPKVALIAAGVVVAVVLVVVLTRPGGSGAQSEVFLQAAAEPGPDPYTPSTAQASTVEGQSAEPPGPAPTQTYAAREVSGATVGLYGGTQDAASCDVERQISYLTGDAPKNQAFASVLGIAPGDVPGYLRKLTPLQLRLDTRVTNHGYQNGAATSYQAVLQAGTAVLVNDLGVPMVRCACGNPLLPPGELKGEVKHVGNPWPGYDPAAVVYIAPAKEPMKEFVVYDGKKGVWFTRPPGDSAAKDTPTAPPSHDPLAPCASTPPPAGVTCPPGSSPGGTVSPGKSPGPSKPTGPTSPGATTPGQTPATTTPGGATTPAPTADSTPAVPPPPQNGTTPPPPPQQPPSAGYGTEGSVAPPPEVPAASP
ncbi:DUF6777 domain-containing protein [Streptomyces katsurahamanus]|uniref:DUF6777 domain-containing protein n=1 Tax=Streptomyces katsurahamanus TaxID=2577098 RepID=A0ABW9NY17_9ACTN|nr:DUF6777 domain-containing protein [Streptomyces katsurahamanus]MQS38128.1 hypothetical protein [Streptomyces katsurahamanus]